MLELRVDAPNSVWFWWRYTVEVVPFWNFFGAEQILDND